MRDERRIGDPFRQPRFSDAILPRYRCDHVKAGAEPAVQVKCGNETIQLCGVCYQNHNSIQLTTDGKVIVE